MRIFTISMVPGKIISQVALVPRTFFREGAVIYSRAVVVRVIWKMHDIVVEYEWRMSRKGSSVAMPPFNFAISSPLKRRVHCTSRRDEKRQDVERSVMLEWGQINIEGIQTFRIQNRFTTPGCIQWIHLSATRDATREQNSRTRCLSEIEHRW